MTCALSPLLIGSVSVDRVDFSYTYGGVNMHIYFNNLMENPFYNDESSFFESFDSVSDVPCILNQLVFRNTDTNATFQAEYQGACTSFRSININNVILIRMNPRDFLRLLSNKFIDTNSTTVPLEMYTADMLGAPFNLQIEPDNPFEFDVRVSLSSYVGVNDLDYWINDSILLIHFNAFIEVATVNASKLSLSLSFNQDNAVNITNGEVLNHSPGLTSSVAIRLSSNDQDLLASKGICIIIQDCYLGIEEGFAAAYFGEEVSPTTSYRVRNIRRAPTGEQNACGSINDCITGILHSCAHAYLSIICVRI